jgi:hypothetical protein
MMQTVPVQPGRPNHRPPRTIWLCYSGILGDVDPFAIDLNAMVTVMGHDEDIYPKTVAPRCCGYCWPQSTRSWSSPSASCA